VRKHLFVVFTDDSCRQNHALMWALDLHAKGHHVRVILEGTGTRAVSEMTLPDSRLGTMLKEARDLGILAGACDRASHGCACEDPSRKVADLARDQKVELLADLNGHAGIESFVREGYELVVF